MNPLIRQPLKAISLFFLLMFASIKATSQNYVLYGMIGNSLVSIDQITGDATEIAALSPVYNEKVRLAYVPYLDKIFTIVDAFTNPKLAWIDRCTGNITVVGPIDQQSPFVDIRIIEALSFNPSDGILYASGYNQPYPPNTLSRWIMSIDPLTGDATIESPLITGTITNEADELFFTSGGAYILDGIGYNPAYMYSLNLSTGVAILVMSGVQSDPNTVHPITGVIYGVSYPFPNQILHTISIINNTTTPIGQIGYPGEFGANQVLVGMTFALDSDVDGDGSSTCDCDDNDSGNFPGNTEICDGQDNNCNGVVDEGYDQDGDNYTSCGGDCDDNNAAINPASVEICDGIDNNCNGNVDDAIDPSPINSLNSLIALVGTMGLLQKDEEKLTDKLNQAINKLNQGNSNGAIGSINGFIGQVGAFVNNGKLTQSQGDLLQEIAECIINSISSGQNLIVPPGNSTFAILAPEGFQLSPNPASNILYLDLQNYLKQELSISIFNQLGQQVLHLTEQELHDPVLSIDLGKWQLPDGIYLLSVRTAEGQTAKQFVLNRQ